VAAFLLSMNDQSQNESPEKQELNKTLEGEIITLQSKVNCDKGSHFFIRKSGTEVTCTKCPIGYPVGPSITLKDGHLYKDNQFLI
jgi:hypothetical protein